MPESRELVQEQIVALRRNHILDAATRVFARKGFHRATIRDVANEAGIADGTIYNYFDDKEALLVGILDRLNQTEARAQHFDVPSDADVADFIAAYLKERMTLIGNNVEVIQSILPELLVSPDLREKYEQKIVAPTLKIAEEFFQARMERGELRATDASLLTRILAGTALGLLVVRLLGDPVMQERWDDAPAVLADLLLNGLQPR